MPTEYTKRQKMQRPSAAADGRYQNLTERKGRFILLERTRLNMHTMYVRARLDKITPHTLFRLAARHRIIITTSRAKNAEKGCLSYRRGLLLYTIWVNSGLEHREQLITTLHELFHIVLHNSGHDDFYYWQEYNDAVLTEIAVRFMRRWPHAVSTLWRMLLL